MKKEDDITIYYNQFDETTIEFYPKSHTMSELEGAFEIQFDYKLFIAPKKILRLQKRLKSQEKWSEEE